MLTHLNGVGHGLEQLDELGEAVVAELALATKVVMKVGYELVELNGEARLLAQHVDNVGGEASRAHALLLELHNARYVYEGAAVDLLAAHDRVGQLGEHVLEIADAVVAYVEGARVVALVGRRILVGEHLLGARVRLEHLEQVVAEAAHLHAMRERELLLELAIQYLYDVRHGLDQVVELCVAVVGDAALAAVLLVVLVVELGEGHEAARDALEQLDNLVRELIELARRLFHGRVFALNSGRQLLLIE